MKLITDRLFIYKQQINIKSLQTFTHKYHLHTPLFSNVPTRVSVCPFNYPPHPNIHLKRALTTAQPIQSFTLASGTNAHLIYRPSIPHAQNRPSDSCMSTQVHGLNPKFQHIHAFPVLRPDTSQNTPTHLMYPALCGSVGSWYVDVIDFVEAL